MQQKINHFLEHSNFLIFFQTLDDYEWEFPRHQLKILSMLGEGCFGQVWKYEAEEIGGDMGKASTKECI